MKPLPAALVRPSSIAKFAVDWAALVARITPIAPASSPWLAAIGAYSNTVEIDGGIVALSLELAADVEFDRLLGVVHQSALQHTLAAHVLARTAVAEHLGKFAPDTDALAARVEEAKFVHLSPFYLEGTMAEDLYYYGMGHFFCDDHPANEARTLARSFLAELGEDDLEALVPLTTRAPWGDWFDPHSCSDRSWLVFHRHARRAFVAAFSHSD